MHTDLSSCPDTIQQYKGKQREPSINGTKHKTELGLFGPGLTADHEICVITELLVCRCVCACVCVCTIAILRTRWFLDLIYMD